MSMLIQTFNAELLDRANGRSCPFSGADLEDPALPVGYFKRHQPELRALWQGRGIDPQVRESLVHAIVIAQMELARLELLLPDCDFELARLHAAADLEKRLSREPEAAA